MPSSLGFPGIAILLFANPSLSLDALTLTAVLFLQDAVSHKGLNVMCNLATSRYPQTQASMVMISESPSPARLLPLNFISLERYLSQSIASIGFPCSCHLSPRLPQYPVSSVISFACSNVFFPGHQTQTQWCGLSPSRPFFFPTTACITSYSLSICLYLVSSSSTGNSNGSGTRVPGMIIFPALSVFPLCPFLL
jgi:hypothetical protein